MATTTQPGGPWLPYIGRKVTVDEYHQLLRNGTLQDGDPVELLEGHIVYKMSRNPPHDAVLDQTREMLQDRLPAGWRVRVQSAITTPDSEPEPDLALVPGPASRYAQRHPGPQDVAVVVEVADTSLALDRATKARIYAAAGIVIYWIINIPDRMVEVYTDSTGSNAAPRYRQRQDFGVGQEVPLVLLGQEVGQVPVQQLFP